MSECTEMMAFFKTDEPMTIEDRKQLQRILEEHWEPTGELIMFQGESPFDWDHEFEKAVPVDDL